ncbi:MAG: glycosyltransferase family 2 protein [Caldilineaceae bacterium]|nr:glycosyltransferase family 2 protein [Caldilineaceae bacterium]
MKRVSIIIVSWNTRQLLEECLESVQDELAALGNAAVETFVVDNASDDGSVAMVQARFPWVQRIENRTNIGFARANNQAIAVSSGEYVLLLNPDTRLLPGALATLVSFMEQTPAAGAAGSRLLNADGSLQRSCYRAPTVAREFWRLFHLDKLYPFAEYPIHSWPAASPRTVDIVQGASMIIRRRALEDAGTLDETYFMYSEEVDLCERIRRAGWEIYWVPGSAVIHYGGQSTRQVADAMFIRLYEGKILFFRKHYGPLAVWLYKIVLFLSSLPRIALSLLAAFERMPRRQQHRTLAARYWRLVQQLPGL